MLKGKLPVLKMTTVYSSNGAGKSNLLKGIHFLKANVTKRNFLEKET